MSSTDGPTRTRSCNNCGGTGTDDNDATCALCDGQGEYEVEPRRRKKPKTAPAGDPS